MSVLPPVVVLPWDMLRIIAHKAVESSPYPWHTAQCLRSLARGFRFVAARKRVATVATVVYSGLTGPAKAVADLSQLGAYRAECRGGWSPLKTIIVLPGGPTCDLGGVLASLDPAWFKFSVAPWWTFACPTCVYDLRNMRKITRSNSTSVDGRWLRGLVEGGILRIATSWVDIVDETNVCYLLVNPDQARRTESLLGEFMHDGPSQACSVL